VADFSVVFLRLQLATSMFLQDAAVVLGTVSSIDDGAYPVNMPAVVEDPEGPSATVTAELTDRDATTVVPPAYPQTDNHGEVRTLFRVLYFAD
jgi:hypothetical protein